VSRKVHASLLFFLFTLAGSVLLFFSLLLLYSELGSFSFGLLSKIHVDSNKQLLLCLFIFFSFAVKVPMVPFHIWLPEAHVEAPTIGSVILAGILLKLGGYGFIRILFPFFPSATYFYLPLISVLSLIGVLYPSFIAIRQLDLKRIIAYSSISHMNLSVIGLFSPNILSLSGSCFLMVAHGGVASLFFFLVGSLYDRHSSRLYLYYGGLQKTMPLFSFALFLASLCNLGFPGTLNFIGETLIFLGLAMSNKFIFFISVTCIIFSSIYTLYIFNRLCFGNLSSFINTYEDLSFLEFFVLCPLFIVVFILGVYPSIIVDLFLSSLSLVLEKIKV